MLTDAKRTNWLSILIKVVAFFIILIILNSLIVYLFGSQIWSNASYMFGSNLQTTVGILLFIEGGILLALGSLWAFGSYEKVSYGKFGKTYGGFSKEDWESRKTQTENPGNIVKTILIVGGLTLIAAFIFVLI